MGDTQGEKTMKNQVDEDKPTLADRASSPRPAQTRTDVVRAAQRSGGGEVTAVMVSRAEPEESKIPAAFAVLKEAMQSDFGYAWSWHCNLAMTIYDESRPQCYCETLDGKEYSGHRPECAIVRAHDARHFEEHRLSHAFCNNAAARFMKLCFDVDTSEKVADAHFTQRAGAGRGDNNQTQGE